MLRLLLATGVLLSHASGIAGTIGAGNAILHWIFQMPPDTTAHVAEVAKGAAKATHKLSGPARPLTLSYLPMFFALSGFLVAGSALRARKLLPFLGLRALRLVPALFVEVMLSALLLGTIFTSLPLAEYFSHPQFWTYFWNILGHPQYLLPGVFTENSDHKINANLWTLPWELYCYVAMAAAMLSGLLFKRRAFTLVYALVAVTYLVLSFTHGFQIRPAHVGGPTLLLYFLTGILLYLWRDRIIFHEAIFIVFGIACYVLMLSKYTVFIYPLMLTYVTAFIGLLPLPKINLVRSGDYSYGIYLYGYPVTQAIIAEVPSLKGNLLVLAPTALVLTACFAAFSWHCVEKHCLKLKRYIVPKSAKISEVLHPEAFAEGRGEAAVDLSGGETAVRAPT